jgi:hypothetical protein
VQKNVRHNSYSSFDWRCLRLRCISPWQTNHIELYRYSETINQLYSGRVFSFRQLDGPLGLSITIPPQRLQAITSLRIDGSYPGYLENYGYTLSCVSKHLIRLHKSAVPKHWTYTKYPAAWHATCAVIGGMKGLKKLHVHLSHQCFEPELYESQDLTLVAEEEFIFGPLREICILGLEVFEVEVDWLERSTFKKGEAPFRLTRRPWARQRLYSSSG